MEPKRRRERRCDAVLLLLTLVTTDNALARLKGTPNTAPKIRTAFHIDSHYEYFQPEGLSPRVQNMVIGNVTEKLETMIANSRPIKSPLVALRDLIPMTRSWKTPNTRYSDTARFLARAQVKLDYFEAMKLSGHQVTSIKNYLTGKEISKGVYDVSLYSVGQRSGDGATVQHQAEHLSGRSLAPVHRLARSISPVSATVPKASTPLGTPSPSCVNRLLLNNQKLLRPPLKPVNRQSVRSTITNQLLPERWRQSRYVDLGFWGG